jgi:hypothetical protein
LTYKLLCIFPNINDATSFYRGLGPLAELQKSGDIEITTTHTFDWTEMVRQHAVFMQRPYKTSHLEIIKLAKTVGLKVWLDYDDDLFAVPRDNPVYHIYAQKEVQATVRACIDLADAVTVSTQALAHLRKDAVVVNNALNLKYLPFTEAKVKSQYIAWRGSASHQRDLLTYRKEIATVSNDTESVMVFMGDFPWYIFEGLGEKKAYSLRAQDVFDYHRVLANKVSPKALMVPLVFSRFNESKSNIAWIESTYAGALSVVPDMAEWRRPGAFVYKDEESFGYQLKKAFNCGEAQHIERLEQSREDIKENYNLEKINQTRMQIIREIVK